MEPREETAQSTCSACQRSIPDTYFEAAGRIFCEPCRDAVMASLRGGSGASRLLKALVFGVGAAAVSAVVWYGIVKLTGYELGIIAIAVGFAVGAAVRIGRRAARRLGLSDDRGAAHLSRDRGELRAARDGGLPRPGDAEARQVGTRKACGRRAAGEAPPSSRRSCS